MPVTEVKNRKGATDRIGVQHAGIDKTRGKYGKYQYVGTVNTAQGAGDGLDSVRVSSLSTPSLTVFSAKNSTGCPSHTKCPCSGKSCNTAYGCPTFHRTRPCC